MSENTSGFELKPCLKRISRGDRDALKGLYEAYHRRLYIFSLSIVKNHEIAQEVTQEFFLSLMSAKSFREIINPESWLYSAVRYISYRVLQTENKVQKTDIDPYIDTSSVTDRYEDSELPEALSLLDDTERQIVVLYVYSGISQKEIAGIIGLPYTRVRTIYRRAADKLRKYYRKEGGINEA